MQKVLRGAAARESPRDRVLQQSTRPAMRFQPKISKYPKSPGYHRRQGMNMSKNIKFVIFLRFAVHMVSHEVIPKISLARAEFDPGAVKGPICSTFRLDQEY